MSGSGNDLGLPAGQRLDVFCETCWRIWPATLQNPYKDAPDFDKRNRVVCPLCSGNRCRAARPADITVKPRGGDRI